MKIGYKKGSSTGRTPGRGFLLDSWFWISVIFFGQTLCSTIFSVVVKIDPGEIFLPILVLFLGGVFCLVFFRFGASGPGFKWQWILPAPVYGTFIFLMSSRSFAGVEMGFDTSYFHPVEFATLGLLLGRIWYSIIERKGFLAFSVRVLLAGVIFGGADEIHQAFVPGRTPDWMDLMFDIAGILISLLIIATVRAIRGGRAGSRLS